MEQEERRLCEDWSDERRRRHRCCDGPHGLDRVFDQNDWRAVGRRRAKRLTGAAGGVVMIVAGDVLVRRRGRQEVGMSVAGERVTHQPDNAGDEHGPEQQPSETPGATHRSKGYPASLPRVKQSP